MARERTLINDGMWVATLQGFAALGQLAGIRMLTEVLPPAVFGEFSLWFGMVALVATGLANPTMQAMLRYYPEYALRAQGALVKSAMRKQLARLAAWVLPVFMAGAIATLYLGLADMALLGLLAALVAVEIVRMQNMALLNAVRAHRAYGIWAVLDSWGRPLLASLMIVQMGASPTLVLAGYLLSSLLSWAVMRQFVPRDKNPPKSDSDQVLASRLWKYTLPLLPLGILGWASGMADRYMIGALLSPADVGLYVAIYGLASRPMVMLGSIVETTIRPAYQHALITRDTPRAQAYLRKWALLIVAGSCVAITVSWVGHSWIAALLLGENYRTASYLLPWIVGGYALLVLSHIANRVCYANEDTQKILLVETSGALFAVVIGLACIHQAGLWGAAVAVPLYFGGQLFVSYVFARPWLRLANQV